MDPPPDGACDVGPGSEQPVRAPHVEEGLVQPDALDQRRDRGQDLVQPSADLGVNIEPTG